MRPRSHSLQEAEARLELGTPRSLQDACSRPRPGRIPAPGSHQTQEGGTQDHGDEPAQHASRPAAPPGTRHRLILRRGLGLEEPLPGTRGPGPAEFQLQLQLGGSGEAVLLPPGFSAEPRELGAEPGPAPPGPAVPAGATSPPSWPPSGPGSPTSELAGGCRPTTHALQPSRCLGEGGGVSRGGNVASRQPQPASNRKFMWLPGRPDFALGPGHHTQLSPQRPRERAPRGGVS